MLYALLSVTSLTLVGTTFLIIQYMKEFKATRAKVGSVSNEIKQMRQEPPKIRIPYEQRLRAEYEKRGLKWETTTK